MSEQEVLAQPQCIRCHAFMAWNGAPCARCGWPEIYDEAGNVTRPWPPTSEEGQGR